MQKHSVENDDERKSCLIQVAVSLIAVEALRLVLCVDSKLSVISLDRKRHRPFGKNTCASAILCCV